MKLVLLVCLILSINSEVSKCLDYYHYPQYNTESSEETDNYRENAQEPEIDNVRDICADMPAFQDSTASWTMVAPDIEKPSYLTSSLVSSSSMLPRLSKPIRWEKFYYYVDINMPDSMLKEIRNSLGSMNFFVPCLMPYQLNKFMDLYHYYAKYGAIFFYSKSGECSSYLGQTGTVGPLNSIHEIHLSSRCAADYTVNAYVFRALGYVESLHDSEATRDKNHPPCWSNLFGPKDTEIDKLRDLYNCDKCPGDRNEIQFGTRFNYYFVVPCAIDPNEEELRRKCRKLREELGKTDPNSPEFVNILQKILDMCGSIQI